MFPLEVPSLSSNSPTNRSRSSNMQMISSRSGCATLLRILAALSACCNWRWSKGASIKLWQVCFSNTLTHFADFLQEGRATDGADRRQFEPSSRNSALLHEPIDAVDTLR